MSTLHERLAPVLELLEISGGELSGDERQQALLTAGSAVGEEILGACVASGVSPDYAEELLAAFLTLSTHLALS